MKSQKILNLTKFLNSRKLSHFDPLKKKKNFSNENEPLEIPLLPFFLKGDASKCQ